MVCEKAVVACVLLLLIFQQAVRADPSDDEAVLVLTDENYHVISTGEWMVEFYAPWCPHCRQFASVWQEFGRWARDTSVRVAMVDVVEQPMLAGQFMISQLPTIYHVKDGAVREYDFRDRSLQGFKNFVEEGKWRKMDAIPWFKSPTSPHMKVIGMLFSAAQGAKVIEEYLRKEYDMETWQIFVTVAAVTVVTGLAVGGVCVLLGEICSRVCGRKRKVTRTRRPPPPPPSPTEAKSNGAAVEDEKSSGDEGKHPDSDEQEQAKDDSGKPQDVATGTHTEDTTKQSPGGGKGKGGDRKQDGDGGGVRQRKGLLGGGKKKGKK